MSQANSPYLEDSYPHLAELNETIRQDVVLSEDLGKPNHFKSLSRGNIVFEEEMDRLFLPYALVDQTMRMELEQSLAINWCRTSNPLLPLKTIADGNCLLHAIALFLWGIQDSSMFLRRLLYMTLSSEKDEIIKNRWRHERGYVSKNVPCLNLDSRDWEEEWDVVLKLGDETRHNRPGDLPYSSLEEIHIFVMANILRRPIIVLCDPVFRSVAGHSIQPNNFGGIYLPLQWDPKQCWKYPIVLGYHMSHFVPLVSRINRFKETVTSVHALHVVPLVHKDLTSLRLHFLLPHEEDQMTEFLNRYLKMTEITLTQNDGVASILAAQLNVTPLPEEMNIIRFITKHHQFQHQYVPATTPANMIGDQRPALSNFYFPGNLYEQVSYGAKCTTPECTMTGLPETNGLCSQCFSEFSKQDAKKESAKRQMPRMPSAPIMSLRIPSHDKNKLISVQQQPSEAGADPSHLFFIPQGQRSCAYPVCTNPVSSLDGHLCHGCLSTLKSLSPTKGPLRSAASKTADQSELFGSGNVELAPNLSTTNLRQNPVSNECLTEGCQKAGKETQRNLCSHCFLASKVLINSQPVSEHQVMVQPTSENAGTKLVGSGPVRGPTSPGIESETGKVKHLCAKPGCEGKRSDNFLGFCTSCYDSTGRRQKTPTAGQPPIDLRLSAQGAGRIASASSDEDIREAEVEQVEESWSESVISPVVIVSDDQKVKCVSPVCSNFVFPPKQLCDNCVETLTREGVRQVKCRKDGCTFHGASDFDGYCSRCYSDLQRTQAQRTARPGREASPWPGREASPRRSHSQELKTPRNRILDVASQQRSLSVPIMSKGKHCVVSNCTRFGDPAMEGMCTRCFQRKYPALRGPTPAQPPYAALYMGTPACAGIQTQNGAWAVLPGLVTSGSTNPNNAQLHLLPSEGDRNRFAQNMVRLETGRKSPRCRNESFRCPNYGSPTRQGYCTSCFERLRGEDVVDTSRHVNPQVPDLMI